jgi:hypothetical protein
MTKESEVPLQTKKQIPHSTALRGMTNKKNGKQKAAAHSKAICSKG